MQIRQKPAAHCGLWSTQKNPPAPLGLCAGRRKGREIFLCTKLCRAVKESLLGTGLGALSHQIPALEGAGCQGCTERTRQCLSSSGHHSLLLSIPASPLLLPEPLQERAKKKGFSFFSSKMVCSDFSAAEGENPALCAGKL